MRRLAARVRPVALILCAASAAVLMAQNEPAPTPTPQVFRGGVDFVYVDAYPRRNDQLVEGLTAADFAIAEDGKPQTIETFALIRRSADAGDRRDPRNADEAARWVADPRTRVFIVYLDLYHITRSAAHFMRGAMMEFLSRTIGPSDVIVVMTPETPVSEIVFAGTLNTLSSEIERYWEWGLADPPVILRTPAETALAACADANGYDALIRRHRDVVLFTSLESLMMRLGSMRDERTSLIFLSEGWANASGGLSMPLARAGAGGALRDGQFGPFGRQTTDVAPARQASCGELLLRIRGVDFRERFKQLLLRANAANVTFYPVDVGGLRTYAADASMATNPGGGRVGNAAGRNTLLELAENTDGFATTNSNDLPRAFQRITDSLAAYYLLGYYSTNAARDGKFRKIEVTVRPPGVQVTARRGYLAPTDSAPRTSDLRVATAPVPQPVAEALSRLSRLNGEAQMFSSGAASASGVDLVAEITSREVASGRWRDGAAVRVELTGPDGGRRVVTGRIDAGRRSVALHVPVESGERGPWQASIGITGSAGELVERVTIAPLAATWLGEPRVYRGPPNVRLPLEPAAAPVFQRGERARVEWPLVKPASESTVRVLDRRGQPLALGAALADMFGADGTTITADLNLAALAEGEYVFDVQVRAGVDTDQGRLAFRVGR